MIRIPLILYFLGFLRSQNFPDFEVLHFENPHSSSLFLHTMSEQNRSMAIIDSGLDVQWHVRSNHMGLDFKVNQNYLTYYNKIEGSWILANQMMNEVDTLMCEGSYVADYHDIQILENGNYLLQAYDSSFVDMSTIIDGGQSVAWITGILVIQMFDINHELISEWNAWDHLDISQYINLNLQSDAIEWMHGNSIEWVGNNQILVSNRASNEILKIDLQSGEVIWHIGGPLNQFIFINDPKQGFRMQHDVRRLENGNISLFDNGVTHTPPISRALEYQINEEEKTAELVWEYTHQDSIVGFSMGSVQILPNENRLINWGSINNRGALITEVTTDKVVVLEIQFPNPHKIYKARKNDWAFSMGLLNGDTNLDNNLNIIDIIHISDSIGQTNVPLDLYHLFRFDTNKDGQINISDVEYIVNLLLHL